MACMACMHAAHAPSDHHDRTACTTSGFKVRAALSWDQGAASMKKLSAAVPKMYIAKRDSPWMRAPSLGVVV
jgi:hypothetical protein